MRPVNLIILHCSATPDGADYPPEALERDHLARGFSQAGYHFYVRRSGEIVPMRHPGMVGAHVKGHNRHSIGVCYEGGLGADGLVTDTRTPAQKDSLNALILYLTLEYPDATVCGHRDLSPDANYDGIVSPDEWVKGCPGFDARLEYGGITLNDEDENEL